MAYQNVGTPRFYVDIFQWLNSQGMLTVTSSQWEQENLSSLIGINPTEQIELIPSSGNTDIGFNDTIVYNIGQGNLWKEIMPDDKNFFMVLGHNLKSAGASVYVQEAGGNDSSLATTGLVNYGYNASNSSIENDGFSISIGNDAHDVDTHMIKFRVDSIASNTALSAVDYTTNPKIGSLLYGNYYDMPNSPDLSLKLSFEYDGVKIIQTRGGATLSNATYTKPADWGDGGAWQLGSDEDGNPVDNLRSGRRVWDLSFSYISDSDLMPMVAANSNIGADANDTTLLDGSDFFSQVWNRTLGGHLPFIFQANSSNNSPDQFSICRFDMNSLQYDQVANGVYNCKLKLREVW
jgi:hypothetical protein